MLAELLKRLKALSDPQKAVVMQGFFKTGPGQYGEGDEFWGISVPSQREVAKRYSELPLQDIQKLLDSPIHEQRLVGLMVLGFKYKKTDPETKAKIVEFYLKNTGRINNWDLVDESAPGILAQHLLENDRQVLGRLARSESLWERRIAIVSTWALIRKNDFSETLKIAKLLLNDREDLIHKAVGWMLREVGKRDEAALTGFLDRHSHVMPRTALRYAIERLTPVQKARYMQRR